MIPFALAERASLDVRTKGLRPVATRPAHDCYCDRFYNDRNENGPVGPFPDVLLELPKHAGHR